MLDEATLAAATNGEVFADPLGKFLDTRQGSRPCRRTCGWR